MERTECGGIFLSVSVENMKAAFESVSVNTGSVCHLTWFALTSFCSFYSQIGVPCCVHMSTLLDILHNSVQIGHRTKKN